MGQCIQVYTMSLPSFLKRSDKESLLLPIPQNGVEKAASISVAVTLYLAVPQILIPVLLLKRQKKIPHLNKGRHIEYFCLLPEEHV